MTIDAPLADTSSADAPTQAALRELAAHAEAICDAVAKGLTGKRDVVETTIAVLLSRGHLLLEDVPGVGKTTLATALGKALGLDVARIQFTPDLLPSDLTGVNIYRPHSGEFEFRPGPLFSQVVVGDEVNRASPKTQSALLECMQEGQVTVDGTSYELPSPFFVIATQNPIEMDGTYPLPEAQRDRFTARLTMGYPPAESELSMLDMHDLDEPTRTIRPIISADEVHKLSQTTALIYAAKSIKQYILDLVHASRESPHLQLGASPRAAIQLLRVAKAHAAITGRDHVLPDDIKTLASPVLAHRLIPEDAGTTSSEIDEILKNIITNTPIRVHRNEMTPPEVS